MKPLLVLRSIGRNLGLNRVISNLLRHSNYEDRFQTLMLQSIQTKDCVWDVGANVGLYTKKISSLVGPQGKVCAFEPSPANLRSLQNETHSLANVEIHRLALGESESTALFQQGADSLGATSRIVEGDPVSSSHQTKVQVSSGDALVSEGKVQAPCIIKIDTEGFELEVLRGLKETLGRHELRGLFIEVHFKLLEERGIPEAPRQIEGILEKAGFYLRWADASHLVASRRP